MASGSLGVSNFKTPNLSFQKRRIDNLQKPNDVKTWIGQRLPRYPWLVIAPRFKKAVPLFCSSSLEVQSDTNAVGSEETISSGLTSQLIPNAPEVEFLVNEVCETTSVAEFELKLDGFRLYILRDLTSKPGPPPVFATPTTSSNTPVAPAASNGSATAPSLAITKAPSYSGNVQTSILDKAADEGLLILKSPKVGTFRRCLTRKGKVFPPACREKQMVKEGQVVCFIEHIVTQTPIWSDVSGEVVKFLRKDGDPVGYGDPLIAILPSFPGIKYLQ